MSDLMAHKYDKLVSAFLLYAEHLITCKSWSHRHRQPIDKRAICTNGSCDCGLLDVLTLLRPDIEYTTPCTDTKPDVDVYMASANTVTLHIVPKVPKTDKTGIDSE